MTINYAHRGASGYYPENTMLAFEKAVELGCTGIETDVHMTRDGYLVLMHDEKVDRTTDGTGYINDYSLEELKKLDAGKWKASEFGGTGIPTVQELIELAKDKNIIVNFEIKTDVIWYKDIEQKLIETIQKHNFSNKVIISSFNHYTIHKCKQIDKSIKTGLLYMEGLFEPHLYAQIVGAEAIHPYFPAIDSKEVIDRVRASKIMINPFTINEEKVMKKFLGYGVDGIITNYPDKLKKLMEGK
ncbi:putative glycerophosphodiester phosphodiesterase [Clostridiales bacterium oral taxon 876 str. F0540]|nr:putative glycerophosphodiester phosphodiesterase [Clostridiales bacterium oral taxon 876 str. F0540]